MAGRTHRDVIWRGKALLGRAAHGWAWPGWVRDGRVDGRKPGFDSPATRARGWAGHGSPGSGMVRLGAAWHGVGVWQPSGFEAPTPASPGSAGHGSAGHGRDRQRVAMPGEAPDAVVGHGLVPWLSPAVRQDSQNPAWPGMARPGAARRCRAARARAWKLPVTAVGRDLVSRPSAAPGQHEAGPEWLGWAWQGAAGLGEAWFTTSHLEFHLV